MTLRFAIDGHCLVRKVKQRHWLDEADFCCVSSFTFVTIFLAKKLQLGPIRLNLSKLCAKYCWSLFSRTRLAKTVFFNDVTITSSLRSVVQVLIQYFTIFQSHELSGWFVPKVVKSCQNLSKLRQKYYRSFFLGHGVYWLYLVKFSVFIRCIVF